MLPIKPRPNESMRCCPTMFATNPGPGKQTITSAPGFDFWPTRSMLTSDDMMSHDRKTDITIGCLRVGDEKYAREIPWAPTFTIFLEQIRAMSEKVLAISAKLPKSQYACLIGECGAQLIGGYM